MPASLFMLPARTRNNMETEEVENVIDVVFQALQFLNWRNAGIIEVRGMKESPPWVELKLDDGTMWKITAEKIGEVID